MTVHPDARAFLKLVEGAPPLDTQTPEANRAGLTAALPLTGPKREVASVENTSIAGVSVRVYVPRTTPDALPAVVYFHGGGWVVGDPDLTDSITRDLALGADAVVVSVDYRRAPEHPFPAAIDDAEAVTLALLEGRSGLPIDPSRVAVSGDSAGGNLAAVVSQQLRGHVPGIVHQALVYPVTEATRERGGSYEEFADGHFLSARDMDYFIAQYAGDTDRRDPRLSPGLVDDLTGLPPATVITAECDPLRDEGEAYARAMAEAGVPVTSVRFNGQVHPFVCMAGVIADSNAARRLIAGQISAAFDEVAVSRSSATGA